MSYNEYIDDRTTEEDSSNEVFEIEHNEYIDDRTTEEESSNEVFEIESIERDEYGYVKNWREGICCFCGDECNPMSQACGC